MGEATGETWTTINLSINGDTWSASTYISVVDLLLLSLSTIRLQTIYGGMENGSAAQPDYRYG